MTISHTPPPRISTSRMLARELLLEALGVRDTLGPPTRAPRGPKVRWPRSSIRAALEAFLTHHHRMPTRTEWRQAKAHGLPSWHTMRRTWPSIKVAGEMLALTFPQQETPR